MSNEMVVRTPTVGVSQDCLYERVLFLNFDGTPMLELRSNGKFFVQGREVTGVDADGRVYDTFVEWLGHTTSMLTGDGLHVKQKHTGGRCPHCGGILGQVVVEPLNFKRGV